MAHFITQPSLSLASRTKLPGQCHTRHTVRVPRRGLASARAFKTDVVQLPSLEAMDDHHIELLGKGDIGAIVIPQFLSPAKAAEYAQAIGLMGFVSYLEGVHHVNIKGMSLWAATRNHGAKLDEYFSQASAVDKAKAQMFKDTAPIRQVMEGVQKHRPAGAQLLRLGGREAQIGSLRVIKSVGGALPHTDDVLREMREMNYQGPDMPPVGYQLAANVYMSMPDTTGGELQVWDQRYDDTDYFSLIGDHVYGTTQDKLPAPDVVFRPSTGDLVVFNSRNLHAVNSMPRGQTHPRLSEGCFVAYNGPEQPLLFWS